MEGLIKEGQELIKETLDEEEQTDKLLTDLAEREINIEAEEGAEEGAEEELDEEPAGVGGGRTSSM